MALIYRFLDSKIQVFAIFNGKIAGRKRPVFVDPSHKVRQGGKGSTDRRTEGRTCPLPVHWTDTGGSGGGLAHPQPSLAFRIEFPKICGHTYYIREKM